MNVRESIVDSRTDQYTYEVRGTRPSYDDERVMNVCVRAMREKSVRTCAAGLRAYICVHARGRANGESEW